MNLNQKKILEILAVSGELSPKELGNKIGISTVMLFKHLKKLQELKRRNVKNKKLPTRL